MDCELVGEALGKCGIAVRAGLHCSPLAHRSAGTYEKGTVRASFSSFNSRLEAERLVWEIGHLNRKKIAADAAIFSVQMWERTLVQRKLMFHLLAKYVGIQYNI